LLLSFFNAYGFEKKPVFPKLVIEYPLPFSDETHEVIAVDDGSMLLVSQLTSGAIVKVKRDHNTGRVIQSNRFVLEGKKSGLHGLRVSEKFPDMVWTTLQFNNELVLVNPHSDDVERAPEVLKRIKIPAPGRGPHVVMEYDNELWVTLKDSNHVLRVNIDQPSDYDLFETKRKPIFIAKHGLSGEMFVSQDQSSHIMKINPSNNETTQISIPSDIGKTPVGLISGPDGNVWFVLLKAKGVFGKIYKNSEIAWFNLNSPIGSQAALLHLAFESGAPQEKPILWLLSSSIGSADVTNALIQVSLDSSYNVIDEEDVVVMPTQYSKAHRVLVLEDSVFVTQLSVSMLAQHFIAPIAERVTTDQDSDPYSQSGYGINADQVKYIK